eukprot:7772002-Pyramimonas_sp.AAC.1
MHATFGPRVRPVSRGGARLTGAVEYLDFLGYNQQGQLYFAEAAEQYLDVICEQGAEQYQRRQ